MKKRILIIVISLIAVAILSISSILIINNLNEKNREKKAIEMNEKIEVAYSLFLEDVTNNSIRLTAYQHIGEIDKIEDLSLECDSSKENMIIAEENGSKLDLYIYSQDMWRFDKTSNDLGGNYIRVIKYYTQETLQNEDENVQLIIDNPTIKVEHHSYLVYNGFRFYTNQN